MSRHSAPDPSTTPNPSVDEQTIDDLRTRIDALEAWRTHNTDLLEELLGSDDDLDSDPTAPIPFLLDNPTDDTDIPEIVDLDDTDLIDWVHNHVAAVIARPLRGEHRWCPQWWEHPEALFRFTALHRAWTELAGEPGAALSIWIRDHLDPCLRELMAPNGPFTDCNPPHRHHTPGTPDTHKPIPTLPTAVPADYPH